MTIERDKIVSRMLCTNKVFYGYIVVVAASCIMTIAWGANRTFGVFLKPMVDEFGWSRASISGAFTMAMVIMGGVSIAAGRLSDRFGPRPVLIGVGLFLGLGYVLESQVRSIWQFWLLSTIGFCDLFLINVAVVRIVIHAVGHI